MKKPSTLQDGWRSLEKSVIPKDVHPTQRAEMKRAFYAGANVMFTLLIETSSAGENEPGDAQVDALETIYLELKRFAEDVKAGLA